jgi:hypothetical protein
LTGQATGAAQIRCTASWANFGLSVQASSQLSTLRDLTSLPTPSVCTAGPAQ